MEIKVFKININDDGTFKFIDVKDEEAFNRTLLFLKKNKNISQVELVLNTLEEDSTERQKKLFKVLCQKISSASGMYSYEHVALSFLSYLGFKSINDVTKDKFDELITYSVAMANEVFDIRVNINEENHHVEILE